MKKWIALLVALMMTVLCAMSLAEGETEPAGPAETPPPAEYTVSHEAFELYCSEWADGFTSAKIYPEEDHWHVWISSADGITDWEYSCLFDETTKTLTVDSSLENTKATLTLDEEGSVIGDEVVYSDGAALFFLDGEGKLVWQDEKEDAGAGLAFEKIGWFQGLWVCGEEVESHYELYCFWDVEETAEGEVHSGYKVEIERFEGEAYTHWAYSCVYDPETDTLKSVTGIKEHVAKEGDPAETLYEDGEAEFSLDDDGCVVWKDAKEDAGKGLQFSVTNG